MFDDAALRIVPAETSFCSAVIPSAILALAFQYNLDQFVHPLGVVWAIQVHFYPICLGWLTAVAVIEANPRSARQNIRRGVRETLADTELVSDLFFRTSFVIDDLSDVLSAAPATGFGEQLNTFHPWQRAAFCQL